MFKTETEEENLNLLHHQRPLIVLAVSGEELPPCARVSLLRPG